MLQGFFFLFRQDRGIPAWNGCTVARQSIHPRSHSRMLLLFSSYKRIPWGWASKPSPARSHFWIGRTIKYEWAIKWLIQAQRRHNPYGQMKKATRQSIHPFKEQSIVHNLYTSVLSTLCARHLKQEKLYAFDQKKRRNQKKVHLSPQQVETLGSNMNRVHGNRERQINVCADPWEIQEPGIESRFRY